MISAINPINNKVNFLGTTIYKNNSTIILNKEMVEAVNMSTMGYHSSGFNGYTLVVVAGERFSDVEAKFLKRLRTKSIPYVNFSKTLDWKRLSWEDILEFINKVKKSGLL